MNPNDIIPFLTEESCPLLMTEPTILEFNDLFPTHQDLAQLTERMSRMDVDLNTHDLRIELERMKHHKLHASVNNITKEILPNNNMVAQIQHDF